MERLASALLSLRPGSAPTPEDLSLNEIFRHEVYLKASPARQAEIRRVSSQFRYDEEARKPFWTMYFSGYRAPRGRFDRHLTGKRVLDFGCFTGGRGVRWAEEYGVARLYGCDINPVYIEAASEFAASHLVACDYRVINDDGTLPWGDGEVDTVVTYDVLEHVDDVARSLREMLRVLKPAGYLFAVFPQFHQPFESHLNFVSRTPAVQWVIPARALTRAYRAILDRRGDSAWYRPGAPKAWEKLPTLNGITEGRFMRLLQEMPADLVHTTRDPVLTHGKSFPAVRKWAALPLLRAALACRIFNELLLDRVAVVLRKR
jgi:2-polyprenyl-3-methyl-5-hydroxy-6-metoxy-1,4-benzoquinol methylase